MAAEHTGAMIALVPAEADARRLAMEGGEPVEEMHLTLTYLGKGDDWSDTERSDLVVKVATAVGGRAPIVGEAFHLAYFNPGFEGRDTALVYGVGGRDVEWIQRQLYGVARILYGSKVPEPHRPFVAHVTAAYTDDLDAHRGLVANLGPITFDRVRLAFGGDIIDIPLGAVADDLGRDVESPDEGIEEFGTEADVLTGQGGIGEPSLGIGQLVDEVVSVGELQAQARMVEVDMAGLVAAMGVYAPIRWHGPLAPVGAPTGDKRIFAPGAISQATFPQPLRWQERGLPGHNEAVTVGSILHAEETTWNGEPYIMGHGVFLNPDIIPEVARAVHLIENGVTGPSVDLDSFTAGVGEYGGKQILVVMDARQRGATLVSIPAFADLRIELEYPQDVDEAVDLPPGAFEVQAQALAASAADPGLEAWEAELTAEPSYLCPASLRQEFATTKTQGWESAPIAQRSATFDADDAVKRIQAWAGMGTEDEDEAKFRSMFLWAKPEQLDQDNVALGAAGYRLPWGDIFDGKPYLVYHAVYAASALLEGGHGGLPNIPDSDKAQLRNTITKIYARLSEEFDDPSVRASWDAREASSMGVETFDGKYTESKHPRDPGGEDGGEWVDVPGTDAHGRPEKGGKSSKSSGSGSGDKKAPAKGSEESKKDSGDAKEDSGGSRKTSSGSPLTEKAALDSAPVKLASTPEGHSGDYSGATADGPKGMGSVKALAEMEGLEFEVTNSWLRRKKERAAPSGVEERVAEVDKSMAVSPLPNDVTVYRGVKDGSQTFGEDAWYGFAFDGDTREEQDANWARWQSGERPDLTGLTWTEGGYSHTTVAESKVGGYAKKVADMEPVAMKIRVPKGTRGIQMSGMDREAELMLQRGLKYRIAKDHGVDSGGVRRLDVEVVRGGD